MNDTLPIIDTSQIEDVKDIMDDKFVTFINRYMEDTEAILFEMDIFRSGNQIDEIGNLAHQLKSSSFHVGASRVQDVAQTIDMMVKQQKPEGMAMALQTSLDSAVADLRAAYADYKDAIAAYL